MRPAVLSALIRLAAVILLCAAGWTVGLTVGLTVTGLALLALVYLPDGDV